MNENYNDTNMEIAINDEHTLAEVGHEFSVKYPFLKLVFFTDSPSEGFTRNNMISDLTKHIRDIMHKHTTGNMSINGHYKVGTLEALFKELYGLNVQVFRKSGRAWLRTTVSDNLSLAELNRLGEEMNIPVVEEREEADADIY